VADNLRAVVPLRADAFRHSLNKREIKRNLLLF
jgi:hypothetical protein